MDHQADNDHQAGGGSSSIANGTTAQQQQQQQQQRPQPTALQPLPESAHSRSDNHDDNDAGMMSASNATILPPRRPDLRPDLRSSRSATATGTGSSSAAAKKKRNNHRGGAKKKRTRKQSFAVSTDDGREGENGGLNDNGGGAGAAGGGGGGGGLGVGLGLAHGHHGESAAAAAARSSFYRLQRGNLSEASLESEALLDHRGQQSMRPRRSSTVVPSAFGQQPYGSPSAYRSGYTKSTNSFSLRPKQDRHSDHEDGFDERTPLIQRSGPRSPGPGQGYSQFVQGTPRRPSSHSSSQSRKRTIFDRTAANFPHEHEGYNVNYPPSVPGSPQLGASTGSMSFGDMLAREDFDPARGSPRAADDSLLDEDTIREGSESPRAHAARRHTMAMQAQEDVCFPVEDLSEMAEEDAPQRRRSARRRRGQWPDLEMLDEWSRFEKEGRSEERRAKKITEPQLIGGRLRPIHKGWHRAEDDAPYRFTYFNEEFQSTIHSQTISELVQPGGSFRELFIPDPPELSDSSDSEEDLINIDSEVQHSPRAMNGGSRAPTRQASLADGPPSKAGSVAGTETPSNRRSKSPPITMTASPRPMQDKPVRYGERPTFWLDVLSPTDAEMKVISKTFGIHPLTAEDIMMQEAREKVELFRNYYFVNYRTFEQDMSNEDFLEPVNMYVVVFREGVISFHFSLTPHPANVRRRIRQLKDYLILSSDWISYAIIDDITDVFAPLIQSIEDEVDDIDDAILQLHSSSPMESSKGGGNEKASDEAGGGGGGDNGNNGADMLRRVGDCRKKVMGLYRLLGNKADVIKGFAKRCNEHWEIAPRSEIGLYLGDIQDHIVTMTGNLSHYEKILARSHGNYLAQINIRMNERQEQTADVLGKLTVLGTIVLPMNIITGLWGMNVWVPGQEYEGDLKWFWAITAGLAFFGACCYGVARRVYGIV